MTNFEKRELKHFVLDGLSFKQIRERVNCSDATIRKYMKIFGARNELKKLDSYAK